MTGNCRGQKKNNLAIPQDKLSHAQDCSGERGEVQNPAGAPNTAKLSSKKTPNCLFQQAEREEATQRIKKKTKRQSYWSKVSENACSAVEKKRRPCSCWVEQKSGRPSGRGQTTLEGHRPTCGLKSQGLSQRGVCDAQRVTGTAE